MFVGAKEGFFFGDDFFECGGDAETVTVQVDGGLPDIFPREIAEQSMGSCVAVDFAGDCDGQASDLGEARFICVSLVPNSLLPHPKSAME